MNLDAKRLVFDGHYYGFRFNYSPVFNTFLKSDVRAGFVWDKANEHYGKWRINKAYFESCQDDESLKKISVNFGLPNNRESLFQALAQAPFQKTAFISHITVRVYTLASGDLLFKFSDYHPSFPKTSHALGGRFQRVLKAWQFSDNPSLPLLRMAISGETGLREDQFEIVQGVYELILDAKEKREIGINLEEVLKPIAGKSNPWEVEVLGDTGVLPEMRIYEQNISSEEALKPFVDGFDLFDYQKSSALFLATHPGAANLSEQGTGKTRTAIVAMKAAFRTGRKLVVCPANLIYNWRDEIASTLPDDTISVIEADGSSEWTVISSSRTGEFSAKPGEYDVLMVDEAHQIKEVSARRTREVIEVAQNIGRVFVMTGTPIPNREEELYTLLKITRHPIGMKSMEEFKQDFCGTPSARAKLAEAIKPWFIRHLKVDVLKLPPKHRKVRVIQPTKKLMKQYNQIMMEPLDPGTKLMKLRALLEDFKLKAIIDNIKKMPAKEKAIIFSMFVEQSKAAAIACGRIKAVNSHGGMPLKQRHEMVRRFTEMDDISVYTGTIQGNSTGLNLQRGNHSHFAGLPWTAADMLQAEDRQHRIGQKRPVYVNIYIVEGTIDEDILELINYKASISDAVLDPVAEGEANQKKLLKMLSAKSTKKAVTRTRSTSNF